MACNLPLPAWQVRETVDPETGEVLGGVIIGLKKPISPADPLVLPCGKCLGCQMDKAKEWTLRCRLEMQQHKHAAFITLTYDDEHCPRRLKKPDLQRWFKRLRKAIAKQKDGDDGAARLLRYFACGEYGETNQRPHYHALVFGASEADRATVDRTWGMGRTQCVPVTPQRIAYVAGYVQKKIGAGDDERKPFIVMSRRPGIGGEARKHSQSWRDYAVLDGNKMKTPRFLHEAWKKTATPEQIELNKLQRRIKANSIENTLQRMKDNESRQQTKRDIQAAKRRKA